MKEKKLIACTVILALLLMFSLSRRAYALGLSGAEIYAALVEYAHNIMEQFEERMFGELNSNIDNAMGSMWNSLNSKFDNAPDELLGSQYNEAMGEIGGMQGVFFDDQNNYFESKFQTDMSNLTPYSDLAAQFQPGSIWLNNPNTSFAAQVGTWTQEANEGQSLSDMAAAIETNAPYAPTSVYDSGNNPTKAPLSSSAVTAQMMRYNKSLSGIPVDTVAAMKGHTKEQNMRITRALERGNVQQRMATDVSTLATSDIQYTQQVEKLLKQQQSNDSANSESFVTAIKDMLKWQEVQVMLQCKTLNELAQFNLYNSQRLARMSEKTESIAYR